MTNKPNDKQVELKEVYDALVIQIGRVAFKDDNAAGIFSKQCRGGV